MDQWLQVLSVIAVVGSVLVLAWQSREVARATRLATRTAVAGVMTDAAANVRAVFEELIEHPELRAYVTDGVPLPRAPLEHSRAQSMCEMVCDALEASLSAAEQIPGSYDALRGWPEWGAWVLANSPGCADHVRQNPVWYPRLRVLDPASG
jgi:hypothetical protein